MSNQELDTDRADLIPCPMCKGGELSYTEEYLRIHIKVDHTREEIAEMLACILLDDHREWLEEAMLQAIGKP